MTDSPSAIPTTIFSGFLGSGKTTIILHLIDELQNQNQQVVYVKNEIGDLAIDSQLVQGKNIQTKELLNGCICCTLVGPFLAAVNEIVDTYHPDRIIIEASGAADPSAIAMMISSHPRLYRDGVISIVDVVNFEGYKDLSTTAQRQTEFTDLIVFNKIELVDLDRKRTVVEYVRELNTHAPILEAPQGKLNPNVVFGLNEKELSQLLEKETQLSPDGHIHSDHLAQDNIQTFECTLQQPVREELFLEFMNQLPPTVFRVKGYVQLTTEKMQFVNKVGKRTELSSPPSSLGFRPTTLVFIGFNILSQQLPICDRLQSCI